MQVFRRIRTVLLIGGVALGLSACVYDPYPYGYGYGDGYGGYYGGGGYYAPYAYGPAPSVSLGFNFADHDGGHWRRWR